MKTTKLLISFFLFLLAFSCKKEDIPANGGAGTGSDIVYNVHKTTFLQLVNNVRQTGCTCGATAMPPVAPVIWNDLLAKAAYDHSRDMNANNYFSHTGMDGSSPGDRIQAAGYNWISYGENIAKGYSDEQAVMNGWLNSEGHCKNIMNGGFSELGVGRDGNTWTQEFGSR